MTMLHQLYVRISLYSRFMFEVCKIDTNPTSAMLLMVSSFVQQCFRNLSECAAQRLCYDRSN